MKILSQDEENLESINSKLDKGRQPQTTRLYMLLYTQVYIGTSARWDYAGILERHKFSN